jgi:hypothetical protein
MAQQFMSKLNANEKYVIYGAIVVVVAALVGAVGSFGYLGAGSGDLAAAVAVAVIYWLKYQPTPINWPVPPQTIVLVIAAVAAFFAVISLLSWLSGIGISLYTVAVLLNAIGCGMMAYYAWLEYQAMPKATTPPAA